MKNVIISITVILFTVMGSIRALAAEPDWTCNPNDFQYDMTVYGVLTIEGENMPTDDYILAAFCNDECRGVAEVFDYGSGNCYYIRVRSNKASEEVIQFRVYDKKNDSELPAVKVRTKIPFESQARIGYPSSPKKIAYTERLMGDVDHSEEVTVTDAVILVNYILGMAVDIDLSLADLNGDGKYSVTDVTKIINIILEN